MEIVNNSELDKERVQDILLAIYTFLRLNKISSDEFINAFFSYLGQGLIDIGVPTKNVDQLVTDFILDIKNIADRFEDQALDNMLKPDL